jgi:enoyl-CoA hydratase
MAFENILYDKKDGIGKIILNRPKQMNALTIDLLTELRAAVIETGQDPDVKVVVITGAGKAFSAGVDLVALGDLPMIGGRVGAVLDDPARAAIETIQRLPKIVIAMVNGFVFTGALELVLGCDLIIAAEEAKLGDTHTKFAIRPSWGMSQRLPRAAGLLNAKLMSYTAEPVTGTEAARMGLVNMAVPLAKLEEKVTEIARKIMANSPEATAAYKYLYNFGGRLSIGDGLTIEYNTEFVVNDTEERVKDFRKK